MNISEFLPLFRDCLQSGYVLKPHTMCPQRSRNASRVRDYVKTIHLHLGGSGKKLSADDKTEFLGVLFTLYHDTGMILLSIYQIGLILARKQPVEVLKFLYRVAIRLIDSPLLKNKSFWDFLIEGVDLGNTATDKAGESYLVKSWADIIGELVILDGGAGFYPDKSAVNVIQSINNSTDWENSLETIKFFRSTSYSPLILSRVLETITLTRHFKVSKADFFALVKTFEPLSALADDRKVYISSKLWGKLENPLFLNFFLSQLTNDWVRYIFGRPHDNYTSRLAQLDYLYSLNSHLFTKFDWQSLRESGPLNEFPAPQAGLMVSRGKTFDSLAMLIFDLLRHYSIPSYLTVKFIHNQLTAIEMSIFEFLVSGGNLRKCSNLPLTLTKRQSYYYTNFEDVVARQPYDRHYYQLDRLRFNSVMIPESVDIPNQFLKLSFRHSLAWIKCLDVLLSLYPKGNTDLPLRNQIRAHSIAVDTMTRILSIVMSRYDELKWVDILPVLIYRNCGQIGKTDLETTLDYINNHIVRNGLPVDFKTKTWANLVLESKAWHQRVILEARKLAEVDIIYPHAGIDLIEIEGESAKYQIEQITSRHALQNEGHTMHHCVSTYHDKCAKGLTFIFRVLILMNDTWTPQLTIQVMLELGKVKIVQSKGKCNRNITPEEDNVLTAWVKAANAELKNKRRRSA